jgi:hypothetical protein
MAIINPTIVVTWDREKYPFYYCFTVVEAMREMRIRIKGAGFKYKDKITITICEKDEKIAKVVANPCGAFEVSAVIPPGIPSGPVSVKAWVSEQIHASWPLDIVEKLPSPK